MIPKHKQHDRESNLAELNAILQKSAGNVANLDDEDIFELQQLCSREISSQLRETYARYYPGVNPLVALLRDETHRLRINQMGVAKHLGVSYVHYNKVVTGRGRIGIRMAKRIQKILGIDANFILENM